MNNASVHAEVKLSSHLVVAEGSFGSLNWQVCDELYARLPTVKRDPLLECTAIDIISPFAEEMTARLLTHTGSTSSPDALAKDWSFQTRRIACVFGVIDWQISQSPAYSE